jgi:hypothetical protein
MDQKEFKMENNYNQENEKARERLKKLVNNITDEELKLVIYKEGWTVAVALGHLAFWDERRLALAKRWSKNQVEKSDITGLDMDTVNDALVPLFLAMPVRKVAEAAVRAAEKTDKAIAGLTAEQIARIAKAWDIKALDRSHHRNAHLDEIDKFLETRPTR